MFWFSYGLRLDTKVPLLQPSEGEETDKKHNTQNLPMKYDFQGESQFFSYDEQKHDTYRRSV